MTAPPNKQPKRTRPAAISPPSQDPSKPGHLASLASPSQEPSTRGPLEARTSPSHAPLPRSFYARDCLEVGRESIGKLIVHASPEGTVAGRIVECEAYRGPDDQAAHSSGGRRTARTEAMFGQPGHAYMFLLYGTSWALNLVTGAEGEPQAVLIRAIEPVMGVELMSARRGVAPSRREISNGPGKLCHALGIDRRFYGADLVAGPLYVADGPAGDIGVSARINIPYAGDWIDKPWRFYERGNRYVSVPPRI